MKRILAAGLLTLLGGCADLEKQGLREQVVGTLMDSNIDYDREYVSEISSAYVESFDPSKTTTSEFVRIVDETYHVVRKHELSAAYSKEMIQKLSECSEASETPKTMYAALLESIMFSEKHGSSQVGDMISALDKASDAKDDAMQCVRTAGEILDFCRRAGVSSSDMILLIKEAEENLKSPISVKSYVHLAEVVGTASLKYDVPIIDLVKFEDKINSTSTADKWNIENIATGLIILTQAYSHARKKGYSSDFGELIRKNIKAGDDVQTGWNVKGKLEETFGKINFRSITKKDIASVTKTVFVNRDSLDYNSYELAALGELPSLEGKLVAVTALPESQHLELGEGIYTLMLTDGLDYGNCAAVGHLDKLNASFAYGSVERMIEQNSRNLDESKVTVYGFVNKDIVEINALEIDGIRRKLK
ncbi:MAG: hypothetical protein ABIB71_07280 [Candidatus Woesearchaeota archaeon]